MVRQEQMEMDMSALDQSLDEVMAANKKKRVRGKGKGRGRGRGGKRGFNNSNRAPSPQRNRSRGGKGGYRGRRGRGFRNNNNNGGPNRVNALNRNKQFKRRFSNNGRNVCTLSPLSPYTNTLSMTVDQTTLFPLCFDSICSQNRMVLHCGGMHYAAS